MFAGHSMLCPYNCNDKGANREIGVPRKGKSNVKMSA
jgi:hypothetical protein